jgi:hypothetical protein
MDLVRINDTKAILWRRGGPDNIYLATRSGKSYSFGTGVGTGVNSGTTTSIFLAYNESLNIAYVYPDTGGPIVKIYDITSDSFSISSPSSSIPSTAQVDQKKAVRINASGNIVQWGRYLNNVTRSVLPLSGTSTLTLGTPVVTQYTSIGNLSTQGSFQILSIAAISDTEAIVIIGNTAGTVKAYKLNSDGSSSQIGSTYTGVSSLLPTNADRRTQQQDMFHNYAATVIVNNSNKNHTYFKATATTFTNFTLTNPSSPFVPDGSSVISLDENLVMFAYSENTADGGSTDGLTKVWVINLTTQSLVYFKNVDAYGFDPSMVGITKWSDTTVLLYGIDGNPSRFLSIE